MIPSHRPRLLIMGGNRYNVASIRSAREAGFETLVVDRNPEAPGLAAADIGLFIDLVDIDRLMEAAREHEGIAGVVSMAEAGVRPAAELCERLGLPTIGRVAAANATSKAAMRKLWSGLPYSTGYIVARTIQEATAAVDALDTLPLVFKPDRSLGGSRGVSRVERRDQIAEAFEFARSDGFPGTDIVIEPFLQGSEHSCEVLIDGERTSLLCVGQKIKSPYPYRVDCSVQYPSPLSPEQMKTVERMCSMAISALGLTTGVAHIEFIYTTSGPVLMELGARCGGGHTPQIAAFVSGVHEFLESCRMACGLGTKDFVRKDIQRGADYRFLIVPPGTIESVTIPDDVRSHPAVVDIDITLKPGDRIGPLRTTADRAGFAVVLGKGLRQTSELADWACSQVVVNYDDGTSAHALTAESFGNAGREP